MLIKRLASLKTFHVFEVLGCFSLITTSDVVYQFLLQNVNKIKQILRHKIDMSMFLLEPH